MSTDWFLFSPSTGRSTMIGSNGLSGVKVWPTEYNAIEFIRFIIENNIQDVVMINEHNPLMDIVDVAT